MRTIGTALLAAAILVVSLGAAGARASSSMVAITRCDAKNINEFQNTVQDYERHPARKSGDQLKELSDLQDIVQGLAQERGVLDAVCPETMSRAKYFTQIAAVEAWAYALQSDMAINLGPPCPIAGNVIPTSSSHPGGSSSLAACSSSAVGALDHGCYPEGANPSGQDRLRSADLRGHLELLGRHHEREGEGRPGRLQPAGRPPVAQPDADPHALLARR